jgi:predicted HAD superfamily Cof-like phosphohydrolase
MNSEQKMVREFHSIFGIPMADRPTVLSEEAKSRRFHLMAEELLELSDAFDAKDIVAIADGIADLLYVTYGTAAECGLDMEPIFAEVHRSNMTKVGGYKSHIGKWIKPPNYSKPNLKPIIDRQSDG